MSFAVLLYGDLIESDVMWFRWLIGGFSAGDGRRGSYLLSSLNSSTYSKKDQVYRIDGKNICHNCHGSSMIIGVNKIDCIVMGHGIHYNYTCIQLSVVCTSEGCCRLFSILLCY